jgi:hypothetical protein
VSKKNVSAASTSKLPVTESPKNVEFKKSFEKDLLKIIDADLFQISFPVALVLFKQSTLRPFDYAQGDAPLRATQLTVNS